MTALPGGWRPTTRVGKYLEIRLFRRRGFARRNGTEWYKIRYNQVGNRNFGDALIRFGGYFHRRQLGRGAAAAVRRARANPQNDMPLQRIRAYLELVRSKDGLIQTLLALGLQA
ncbi:hypothetical protein FRC10_004587 [Ceratobasidium sp. 414]|nr:hypothetical protein FRC10_004587 [Ceratobasidium sp. 414]